MTVKYTLSLHFYVVKHLRCYVAYLQGVMQVSICSFKIRGSKIVKDKLWF